MLFHGEDVLWVVIKGLKKSKQKKITRTDGRITRVWERVRELNVWMLVWVCAVRGCGCDCACACACAPCLCLCWLKLFFFRLDFCFSEVSERDRVRASKEDENRIEGTEMRAVQERWQ